MRVRKLNFNKAPLFDIPDVLVFIKPLGSMLTRVYRLPQGYGGARQKELREVLNTLCRANRGGIWFFDMRDQETRAEIEDTITMMDVMCIYVALDVEATLSN